MVKILPVFFVVVLLTSGCAVTVSTRSGEVMVINEVGDSMPNNEITLHNSASGITARAMLIAEENMLDKGANEAFLFRSNPQIRFGADLTMRNSVEKLLLRVNVHNPRNTFYKVVVRVWEGGLRRGAKATREKIVYEGKLTINDNVIPLPFDRPMATQVVLQDEKGGSLMWFGPFGYHGIISQQGEIQ